MGMGTGRVDSPSLATRHPVSQPEGREREASVDQDRSAKLYGAVEIGVGSGPMA